MRIQTFAIICMCSFIASCGLDPNAPQPELTTGSMNGTSGNASNSNASNASNSDSESGDLDPVAACQEIESVLEACISALSGALNCNAYASLPCDLGPYLNCVADAYGECVDGSFPNLDPQNFQDCAPLATCD